MLIKEIMTSKIITIDINATILDACNKYRDYGVGCLIVTENGQLAGLVTERDVIERTICMDRDPKTTKIKEIMSLDIKTIGPLDKVEKATEMFKKYKIKKLPVVSNDRLVGIVTLTDVVYTGPGINKFIELWKSQGPE